MNEFNTIEEDEEEGVLVSIDLWQTRRDAWTFEVAWGDRPVVSLGGGSYDTRRRL